MAIKTRYRDALESVGVTLEEYRVSDVGDDLPMVCGLALVRKRGGRAFDACVIEQCPRGWGGDGKWYVLPDRTRDGDYWDVLARPKFATQREALAYAVRVYL